MATDKIDPYEEGELYEEIKGKLNFLQIKPAGQLVNVPPKDKRYLTLVLISDTHDQMANVNVPDGDVLIHAGDFTNAGSEEMLRIFNDDLGRLPHKYKIVVAGNHELGFDDTEDWEKREPTWTGQGTPCGYSLITNATYLHDNSITIEGLTFYGASWHPLQGYPFSKMRGPDMEEAWAKMPDKVDVLITHSPPLGYLDQFNNERWGCRHLLKQVQEKNPQLHVFGHVHERYGCATNGQTIFVNAALCDKKNKLVNEPWVFYLPIPEDKNE